jgi:acyl dehydratase
VNDDHGTQDRSKPTAASPGSGRAGAWPAGAPTPGQRAERSRTVSDRDIELFTEISGDRNPLHYDPEVAAASPFGEIVVQGGVTTAILNAVVAEDLPGPGSVFLQLDVRFAAPVRPGDTITGAVEVLEVRPDKPITTCAVSVTRDDGVVVIEGQAVCYTAPVGDPPRAGGAAAT